MDVIGAFNQQEDYEKNRNYWKYLKAKLKKEGSELVSATTQLKLRAADGKFKKNMKKCVDWSLIDKKKYLAAMRDSMTDAYAIKKLLRESLTDDITSREMFMKGIDYSYYYEQEE